jgi:hypothetical protein
MSQVHEGPNTGVAAAALAEYLRVKFGGSTYSAAGIEDDDGTVFESVFNAGDKVTVIPPSYHGTVQMIASGAIAAGANVYPAASGKVSATVAGRRIGKNLTEATADGDVIEVQRLARDTSDLEEGGVNALTGASMQITEDMCKNGHVTTSHSTAAAVLLPAGKVGMRVTITKIDANAQAHTVTPNGAEVIQGAATFAAMDAQYDSVTLEYVNTALGWVITGKHIA